MTPLLKNLVRLALATAFVLLIPLVAMQFTHEVVWTVTDFVFAGTLLFGTGLTYELIARKGGTRAYRLAVGVALAAGFLLIWLNLAVGLIGSEQNPANLLYGGVLVVGITGALLARFRPQGMARTLLLMAAAQVLVPVLALLLWQPRTILGADFAEVPIVLGVTALFVTLWVGAAWLFRYAGTRSLQQG
ncbi:hypothetical protein SAMN02745146_0411 [Hymenobacter daecheongensis DSM 21074]|uniref:Uncharacterized protein n=1 Tax=Hymenobacter daecheongensis DSM 21074 TaxID=1121955 RepID=A0A1M5ZZ70_9BACT|nr:hypothetical protein [Hymenobacter daecheongensis]SHI29577.1 hypothetical protein SAMN02745146_0411 [Hymenobacter daecheongensis DSM 21074]